MPRNSYIMTIDVFSPNTLSVVVVHFCCDRLCSFCFIFVVSVFMVSHLMFISCIADDLRPVVYVFC